MGEWRLLDFGYRRRFEEEHRQRISADLYVAWQEAVLMLGVQAGKVPDLMRFLQRADPTLAADRQAAEKRRKAEELHAETVIGFQAAAARIIASPEWQEKIRNRDQRSA